jgi:hypothetical protein
MPTKHLKFIAEELFESVRMQEALVTYNDLKDLLLRFCSLAIENIDVRSSIGFLELLKSRITDTYIISVVGQQQKRRIEMDVKL